jgi:hypothetical protein
MRRGRSSLTDKHTCERNVGTEISALSQSLSARIVVPSRSGSFSHRPQSPFSAMARKRKLSVGRDAADAPFETVEVTEVEETKVEEQMIALFILCLRP